jgi:PAS domain S-box-containing protein
VEQSRDGIVVLDQNGKVFEANQRFADMLGYSAEELLQLHVWDWDTQWAKEQLLEMIRTVDDTGDHFETNHRRKDGTLYDVEISTNGTVCCGHKLIFCVCRDITERKRVEEKLRERKIELEIKTRSLKEANTAMKVLLKKRKEDKKELEDNVLINVKEMIVPYFKRIKDTKLDHQQKTILSIIESNLNEIISPFTRKISLIYLNLTPTEIQIANLIKHGSSTKKIADLMNVSPRTIDTHRKNIRRKIGQQGQRGNLRSYLISLQ